MNKKTVVPDPRAGTQDPPSPTAPEPIPSSDGRPDEELEDTFPAGDPVQRRQET
jgi:hypothetical protein